MLSSPARFLTKRQSAVIRKAGKRRGHISGSSLSRSNFRRQPERKSRLQRRGILRLGIAPFRIRIALLGRHSQQKIPPGPAENSSAIPCKASDDETVTHTAAQKKLRPLQRKTRTN